MTPANTTKSAPPAAFIAALGVATCVWLLMAWDQSFWWREKEDYGFGWLVPVFVAYTLFERWGQILSVLRDDSESAAGIGRPLRWLAWACLLGSSVMFLGGSLFRAAAGPTNAATLAVTVGGAGSVASLLALSIEPRPRLGKQTLQILALFTFPILIWLISAPMVTNVEQTLKVFLMGKIASIAFGLYDLLGFPIEQQGNVLILTTGKVGVAEACSGIRSLTGCLFAGSFLAAHFVTGFFRKTLLIGAAVFFALVSNLLRSLFLTGWCLAFGAHSIEGTVHDVSGYAVLGLTVVALLLVLPLVAGSAKANPSVQAGPEQRPA